MRFDKHSIKNCQKLLVKPRGHGEVVKLGWIGGRKNRTGRDRGWGGGQDVTSQCPALT